MSRIKSKKLTVNPDPAADSWDWYQRDAAADVDVWLASIDAGSVGPFGKSVEPEIEIPEVEGTFDFAVVQVDQAGNMSDPANSPALIGVSFDLSPPPAATGGQLVDV